LPQSCGCSAEAAERHGQQWARLIALRACGLLALGQGDLVAAVGLLWPTTYRPWLVPHSGHKGGHAGPTTPQLFVTSDRTTQFPA
jgi:hypothetical protein